MIEKKITLIPTKQIGSAVENYELSKILDDTRPVYNVVNFRSAYELKNEARNFKILDFDDPKKTNKELDQELEEYEREKFYLSHKSNKSVFNEMIKTEVDMFLLMSGWSHKQKLKLINLNWRNNDVWQKAAKRNELMVSELNNLMNVFRMLDCPAGKGIIEPPANEATSNQMVLIKAVNNVKKDEEFLELIAALNDRKIFIDELLKSCEESRNRQKIALVEFQTINSLVNKLCVKYNIKKIPYNSQAYLGNEQDYPFRVELWIELLYIPELSFDRKDKINSITTELWDAVNNSQYMPPKTDEVIDEDWKSKKLKKKAINPFLLKFPMLQSPITETSYWCQIFACNKDEQEFLTEELLELFKEAGTHKEILSEYDLKNKLADSDREKLKIYVKLDSDLTYDTKYDYGLDINLTLKSVNNEIFEYQNGSKKIECINLSVMNDTYKLFSFTNYEALDDFLTGLQRKCLEKSIYATLQNEANFKLCDNLHSFYNDETLFSIIDRLSQEKSIEVFAFAGVIIIKPITINIENFDAHLIYDIIPPSMIVMPMEHCNSYVFLCFPLDYTLTKCNCDELIVEFSKIPIVSKSLDFNSLIDYKNKSNINSNRAFHDQSMKIEVVSGFVNITLTISWVPKKFKEINIMNYDDSPWKNRILNFMNFLELSSVSRLRHEFLDRIKKKKYDIPYTNCDLHIKNICPIDFKTEGTTILSNYLKWLVTMIASFEYN